MTHKKNNWLPLLALPFLIFMLSSCDDSKKPKEKAASTLPQPIKLQPAPVFNEDSAYYFVEKQVSFGPRVPNTEAHKACGNWLVSRLQQYEALVTEQVFTEQAFNGKTLQLRNIVGSINPQAKKRILLAAHWDSRPFSDHYPNPDVFNTPIDGANDGASGVGVLLEILRAIQAADNLQPGVGIDVIFFDGEDYGETQNANPPDQQKIYWCLGSQYWAKNKHVPGYSAFYGILLDMVGGPEAKFAKEGYSVQFASVVVNKVWSIAAALGYSDRFISQNVPEVIDDHVFVNTQAKINMIDIIEYDMADGVYFNKHWHTQQDNLDNIDRQTLKAVGQTVMQTLYNEPI